MKKTTTSPKLMIRHREILQSFKNCSALVEGYRDEVLTQNTRTIRLLGRKCSARIIHTLLGYEVQASYKRIQCPDLVTARYLRLFSELGFHSIKLPYDPTLTERLIPVFEATVNSLKERICKLFPKASSTQQYVIRIIYGIIRRQIAEVSRNASEITQSQLTREELFS
jgi:hypothetical protein